MKDTDGIRCVVRKLMASKPYVFVPCSRIVTATKEPLCELHCALIYGIFGSYKKAAAEIFLVSPCVKGVNVIYNS